MKYPPFLVCLVFSLLTACGTPFDMIGYFQSIDTRGPLLPPLEPVWNEQQLNILFPSGTFDIETGVSLPDRRTIDVEMMYSQMIEGGISQITGPPVGFALLDLNIRKEGTGSSFLLGVLAIGLMGVPYLMGIPHEKVRVECVAIVKILNRKEELIGTYMGTGISKSINSAYIDGPRRWTSEVFSLAMKDIQQQIRADVPHLQKLLEEGR